MGFPKADQDSATTRVGNDVRAASEEVAADQLFGDFYLIGKFWLPWVWYGLIFYLSGRGVIHSIKSNMFRIPRVSRVRSWSEMPFWKDSAFRSSVDINLELQRSLVKTQDPGLPKTCREERFDFWETLSTYTLVGFVLWVKLFFPHTKLANPMFCPIFTKQPTIIIDWWIPSLCQVKFPTVW